MSTIFPLNPPQFCTYSTLSYHQDRTEEALQANGKTMEGYLTSFKWDGAKFNVNASLEDLCMDVISKVTDIENEMKKKVQLYNKSQGSLNFLEKQATGTLQVRSLDTLVKKEDFIVDSDFLQTVVVVVPLYVAMRVLVNRAARAAAYFGSQGAD